jgi:hypothetical protein
MEEEHLTQLEKEEIQVGEEYDIQLVGNPTSSERMVKLVSLVGNPQSHLIKEKEVNTNGSRSQ